jgi:hypothetical protein
MIAKSKAHLDLVKWFDTFCKAFYSPRSELTTRIIRTMLEEDMRAQAEWKHMDMKFVSSADDAFGGSGYTLVLYNMTGLRDELSPSSQEFHFYHYALGYVFPSSRFKSFNEFRAHKRKDIASFSVDYKRLLVPKEFGEMAKNPMRWLAVHAQDLAIFTESIRHRLLNGNSLKPNSKDTPKSFFSRAQRILKLMSEGPSS